MIKIENIDVCGWESAIRGMRNPMNSWNKSDSHYCAEDCPMVENGHESAIECNDGKYGYCIGKNDFKLMKSLVKAGSDHRKFMRMITIYVDINAPIYWWKELDTYKVGTVANSCSTMHKIHDKDFELDDFSHEHLVDGAVVHLLETIEMLNEARETYINYDKFSSEELDNQVTCKKDVWWQMIQLLPSSYNQKRTLMLNYEVLSNMYHSRKNHKLDEWRDFCDWIKTLPYSELITREFKEEKEIVNE